MHGNDDYDDGSLGQFSIFGEWSKVFLAWLILYVAMTVVVVLTISAVWLFARAVIRFGEFVFGV